MGEGTAVDCTDVRIETRSEAFLGGVDQPST